LQSFDLVYAMDSTNYRNIQKFAQSPEEQDKIDLIMNLVKPGYNQNVPDPYYNNDGFEEVYQMLDAACEKIIEKYKGMDKDS